MKCSTMFATSNLAFEEQIYINCSWNFSASICNFSLCTVLCRVIIILPVDVFKYVLSSTGKIKIGN